MNVRFRPAVVFLAILSIMTVATVSGKDDDAKELDDFSLSEDLAFSLRVTEVSEDTGEQVQLEASVFIETEYLDFVEACIELQADRSAVRADEYFLELSLYPVSLTFAYDKADMFLEQFLPRALSFFPSDGILKEYAEFQGFLTKDYRFVLSGGRKESVSPLTWSLGCVLSNFLSIPVLQCELGRRFPGRDSFLSLSCMRVPSGDVLAVFSCNMVSDPFSAGFEIAFGTNFLSFWSDYSFGLTQHGVWTGVSLEGVYGVPAGARTVRVGAKLESLVPRIEEFETMIIRPQVALRYPFRDGLFLSAGLGCSSPVFLEPIRIYPFWNVELRFKP